MRVSPTVWCVLMSMLVATGTAAGQQGWSTVGDNATATISSQAFGKLPQGLKEKVVLQLPQRDGEVRLVFDQLKFEEYRNLSNSFATTQGVRPRITRFISCANCDDSGLNDHKVPPVHNGAYGKPALKAPSAKSAARPRLEGRGVRVAMIDQGPVYSNHVEFVDHVTSASRVSPFADEDHSDDHATADAGTLGAAGVDQRARGSAPQSNIVSIVPASDALYWTAVESILDVPISSHSTVIPAGWNGQEWWGLKGQPRDTEFGRYGVDAEIADSLSAREPGHLMVVAAGNDRDDGPKMAVQPVEHRHRVRLENGTIDWEAGTDSHPPDGGATGLQTVVGGCVAKNVICVGAVTDIGPPGQPQFTTFTNFGPTADGRVKPDIVANGYDVFALGVKTRYVSQLQGTSQAAPMVAGIVALIKEAFSVLRNQADPTAAELKAVLLHTAARPNLPPGPDPKLGWGMADAKAASDYLDDNSAIVQTVEVRAGETSKVSFTREEDLPFRVTVVWTDPAQTLAAAPKGALVADVDAIVKAPSAAGSTAHLPWVLDRAAPHAATRAANHVDNVEIIDVANGALGTWTLELSGARLAQGTRQVVAIALPGKVGS